MLITLQLIVSSATVFILFICHAASSQLNDAACLSQRCGNLTVSYPFRLLSSTTSTPAASACPTFSSFFELHCNISSGTLYLLNAIHIDTPTPLAVTHILNDSLIVDIGDWKAAFNSSCGSQNFSTVSLPSFPAPYVIANDNMFVSFGCIHGTLYAGDLKDHSPHDYSDIEYYDYADLQTGGCYVLSPADQCGTIIRRTCCVTPIPREVSPRYTYYSVEWLRTNDNNTTTCGNTASCSTNYATLLHPYYTDFDNAYYGLRLKWALPSNQTTFDGIIQSPDYACSPNANLTIVHAVPGYLCSCYPGYAGDGYSNGSGCSDIDECKDPSTNNCIHGRTTCNNLEGSYTCTCNSRFYVGDGQKNGSGCRFSPHLRDAFVITAAVLGLALFVGSFVFLAIWWKQRLKRKYFMKNGGLELQAYIAARGRLETIRLFSAEELQAATNNFCDTMKLGVGGFGTVFKGTIEDGRVVAVKKANREKEKDSEQFLNEMAILMQINHRHVVRLLGCCLEMATPLLVYEYVSNGNVEESLESNGCGMMAWEQRLKVARQTAEALAYLHAAASPPILHRDVKSRNVLLDDNFDVKVADFGASRLVPDGVEHISATVQGTIGYLDPEYFQTLQLSDKSDVYSLGVMLVELITGLKPIDSQRRFSNLAFLFIDHMQKGRGEELIDPRLERGPSTLPWRIRSSIMAVATLARRCLSLLGDERPSMSHVADKLRQITKTLQGADKDDDDDDEAFPFQPSIMQYAEEHEGAGAVVAHNPQYHFIMQSNSGSICIADSDLFLTMPR